MSQNKARVYFSKAKVARIHNLENPCADGKYITEGNFIDFKTYDDALAEITRRNKRSIDCKKCTQKNIEKIYGNND